MENRVGRGRGRGIKRSEENKVGLQAHEASQVSPPVKVERLQGLIWSLSYDTDEFEILAIEDTMVQLGVNINTVNACIQALLDRCFDNWIFSKSAVRCVVFFCRNDQLKSFEGTSLRTFFLKQLQVLYKQKDDFRAEKPSKKWLGCVSLLCQSLVHITMPDGSPMEVMKAPVAETVELCLSKDSTDEEILCAATQLQDIGPILTNYLDSAKLKQHQNVIRDIVSAARGPREARLLLIDAAEGYASNWKLGRS